MSFLDQLREYVRACFPGLWIVSCEPEEVLRQLATLAREEGWQLAVWDIDQGWQGQGPGQNPDPLAALHEPPALQADSNLYVLLHFHRFLQAVEVIQALFQRIQEGKQLRRFWLIVAPMVQIPPELERQFVVLEHDLPDRQELAEIARQIVPEEQELPQGDDLERLLAAACGLTRQEAEGAFALSLVRHGRLAADTIWELKCQLVRRSGLLQLYRGEEDFSSLGGLAALKDFARRSLSQRTDRCVRPRGILLLGVPGTGKSAFAKALGKETGRPVLILDIGSLYGSLVGQTEQNIRRALRIADAMAPCILFVDEVEKALSGSAASGKTDSGVTARLFGTLLTWMNDHETDVYLVATCNDISRLPPEFSRAERFDAVVFLDLPGRQEKDAIWAIYRQLYGIPPEEPIPADEDWTGAEIRACCRLAALLGVSLQEAAQHVVPVAHTAAEQVQQLRHWASGRCLDAHRPGLYRLPEKPSRRQLVRAN